MGDPARWLAQDALERLALPWLDRKRANIARRRYSTYEDSSLKPSADGPLSIVVRDYGMNDRGFDVFVGEIPEPFELDDNDKRDRQEFETLVRAVLEGRVTITVARTPLGQRIREVAWDDNSWSVPRYLSLSAVRLSVHSRVFPAY
ncbi:hypothetical protein [Labedaea rhizosphaerae]|uniref:hypothetical protein n=1 Tax=Labedaea rhizosphaerae TaxID=598644 RepID=UPI0010619F3A|nr:hypothetical protein [Labedaea rhizosphaerae]